MFRRTANVSGAAVGNKMARKNTLGLALGQVIESLESRVMLSATPPTVNVLWKGQEVPAVQGEYVAQAGNFTAWAKLVAKEDFTNIQSLGGAGFYQFDSTLSTDEISKLAKAHPVALKAVQPNFMMHTDNTFPNDALAFNQYYLQNTGQNEPYYYNLAGFFVNSTVPPTDQIGTPGQDIDATQAWDLTTGSSNVVVAVLDTGIDTTHPDLIPNLWNNPNSTGQPGFANDVNGWNFIDNNNDVTDLNGHGTNVAGVIGAAGNNGFGVTGVNWHVSLLTVKVLDADGEGSDADIISGINYVTMLKSQGVNVVVMNESLGGVGFPLDVVGSNAVKAAGKAGIIDVVAAGNDSANNDTTPSSPAVFSNAFPTVITVAATDNQGKLAAFSNFGAATVDLAAPGVDIFSTSPTYPVELNTEVAETPLLPQFPENYGYLSGTSQATPSVTGIIALEAAAKPNATPAQLKKALLDGVTPDPFLAAQNDLPAKVLTAGVANAYHAVKNILDQFVGTDTTRAGNWPAFFGGQGAYVVGDSTAFPSFVTTTFDGTSPDILSTTTKSLAAPIRVTDTSQRIAAYDASSATEAINLTFTDGASHRVSLYVADLDNKKRTEEVQLFDPITGLVLDTEVVTKFQKGEYLTWDVGGEVQIKLTRLAGPSVVFSGIFFDAVPGNPNVFAGVDTTTAGFTWPDHYGSQGAEIVGDASSQLPTYVTSLTTLASTRVVKTVNNSPIALQRTLDVTRGIEAYYESANTFDIHVNVNNTQSHEISLYLADYDHKRRAERIQVVDPATSAVLYTQDVLNFTKGEFVNFEIPGSTIFRITPLTKQTAVVSGIFFDGAPGEQVNFIGADNVTKGDWQAAGYGAEFSNVAGINFEGVDGVVNNTIVADNVTEKILSSFSADPRALQQPTINFRNDRIASYLFSSSFMTFHLNLGDNLQHQVALYFVDYERLHRVETVTITDPTSGTVLSQQRISNFGGGKYLVFTISGPVNITIDAGSLPNAVISGIFTS